MTNYYGSEISDLLECVMREEEEEFFRRLREEREREEEEYETEMVERFDHMTKYDNY